MIGLEVVALIRIDFNEESKECIILDKIQKEVKIKTDKYSSERYEKQTFYLVKTNESNNIFCIHWKDIIEIKNFNSKTFNGNCWVDKK
jgi:hypothetical protein